MTTKPGPKLSPIRTRMDVMAYVPSDRHREALALPLSLTENAMLKAYRRAEFAVLGWTQALAREMAPHGIRVNAVCPGFVKTSMQEREIIWEAELRGMTPEAVRAEYVSLTPLGRIEEPEDVADLVLFLASDASRFMTGQGINVTGGVRMD